MASFWPHSRAKAHFDLLYSQGDIMTNEAKKAETLVSRRQVATAAGAFAVLGIGAGSAAAETRATMARKEGLTKLSNALYNSPAQRREFLANPRAFTAKMQVKGVNAADLARIKSMIADGFCCGGCGCN